MYSMKFIEDDIIIPLQFNINGKNGVSKFKIEELDMLTSSYLSEEKLLQELLKYNCNNISRHGHLMITYDRNGESKEIPVIYNDKLIYQKAKEIRVKKQKNDKDLILLEKDILLANFISFIKRLARDKNSRPYIIDQESLKDVPYKLRKELKKLVKDDVKKINGKISEKYNFEVLEKGIRSLLSEYVLLYDKIDYKINYNESTLELEKEKKIVEEMIDYYFKKDYRNLREMVAFENKYLEALEYEFLNNNGNNKLVVSTLIQEVRMQKAFRNGYLEQEDLNNLYDSLYIPVFIQSKEFIENDIVRELFNEGGIPAIMEQLSADEIYGKYLKDSKKLGIVKQKSRK